ncbi:PAAR domain-containing protein [Noviherbaspirillum sp. Root189]|uniref:PAAR domain-containing protein n=1 Tax=Noviherbaspirillum sp. Root189 TaxID=1736487 RepID=UPI0007127EB5|nr:PAAR domain-containing protein [Noviherbaspirillum sp. Root189]KRB87866.1 hypothetical protein ASE07_19180 [Noviherbaspirillum sp. Root189]
MSWLVNGVMAGAAIGLGTIAIAGTGGLAATAIVGGLVAGGAGIGEMFSTMSWVPKEVCGVIKGACSGNVFTNGIPAARGHVDVVDCYKHSPPYPPIATGSATVFINGLPAARVGDKAGCSAVISSGSHNVYIGGGTVQTDMLEPEKLVPDGVHVALLVAGVGSAIALGGPIIATAGLIGGAAGQLGGKWVGGRVFGIESDGQKWAMLGGSLLGGVAGAKSGAGIAGKRTAQLLLKNQGAIEGKPYGANTISPGEALRAKYAYMTAEQRAIRLDELAEGNAYRRLQEIESSTPGAHFLEKHGAKTTLQSQRERAQSGANPTTGIVETYANGKPKIPSSATRFLSNRDQLNAIDRAQNIYRFTGDPTLAERPINFNYLIGEGYKKTSLTYGQSYSAQVWFRQGNVNTAFPIWGQ